MQSKSLVVTALGGLYELGKNMWLFEARDNDEREYVVVDAGVLYPGTESPGVDYILPDFKFLLDKVDKLKALVLTSVHDSHFAGAVHFINRTGVKKVVGSKIALAMLKLSLTEAQVKAIEWQEFNSRESLQLGVITVTPLQITSCAAYSHALVVEYAGSRVFYSGTYKLDQTPSDGHKTDLAGITAYCADNNTQIDLYIGDSINSEKDGYSKSDYDLIPKFRDIFNKHKARVIVNTYNSNTLRIRNLVTLAEETGRKVAFLNRTARDIFTAAKDIGYIQCQDDTVISIRDIANYPDEKILVIVTAPEWDALKELIEIAYDRSPLIQIKKGDVIVNSGDLPPGTVRVMAQISDEFFLKEAVVIGGRDSGANADNHALSEEIKFMFNLVRPKYFIPGFGETRQLVRHAKHAVEVGFDPGSIFIIENGDRIQIKSGNAAIIDQIDTGNILFSDSKDFQVDNKIIKEREALARDGVVLVAFSLNKQRKVVSGPVFSAKACTFSNNKEWRAFCLLNTQDIIDSIALLTEDQPKSTVEDYQNLVKEHMNRIIKTQIGKKPSVIVLANEV